VLRDSLLAYLAICASIGFGRFRALDFLLQYSLILEQRLRGIFVKIRVCECMALQDGWNIGIRGAEAVSIWSAVFLVA
jgi:hypothetical protein